MQLEMTGWTGLYGFAFILSAIITWGYYRHARSNQLFDMPNHRSSHTIPTPRGGGISFVITFLFLLVLCYFTQKISSNEFMAFLLAGSLVAITGFCDDNFGLSAKWRLCCHFLACSAGLFYLGGMPDLTVLNISASNGLILNGLAIFYLVWLLNLYNFMDGIDGIASVELITVCVGAALLYGFQHHDNAMVLPLGLAAATAGFLLWNFPPARIFMGDAGSGFLGITCGLLSVQAALINTSFFISWLILMGVFIVNATVTLTRRAFLKERLMEAHCSHAYQQAARLYGSHRKVTLTVVLINVFWLFPWAYAVSSHLIDGAFGLLLAYLPLIVMAYRFNAGQNLSPIIKSS